MKTNAAIYVRVSNFNQDHTRQVQELTQYAKGKGYRVHAVIQEKISGIKKNEERKGITELIQLAKSGKIQKVLIWEVSRLGRRTSEVLKVVEELTEMKVSIFINQYGIETISPSGKPNSMAQLILTMLAEFSRLEHESITERVRSGVARAIKSGKPWGRRKGQIKSREKVLSDYKDVVRYLKRGKHSLREVSKLTDVAVNTIRKVKEALKE